MIKNFSVHYHIQTGSVACHDFYTMNTGIIFGLWQAECDSGRLHPCCVAVKKSVELCPHFPMNLHEHIL
jgi:hypothetical protein